ncbi:MAG TPA: DUF6600 domain-containing protein [Thermoanaerobaculia bacterium]
MDLAFFHNSLAPYGRWVHQSVYGDVFVPRVRYSRWRPYQYGHWVYTDYGWTWVSAESFGWATYHYGRWSYDPDYGWIWVPGTEWGPAWVDWQEGDGYVGWGALPPVVGFDASYGVDFGGFQVGVDLVPTAFVFVPERSFLVANVASFCLPPDRNLAFFGRTRNITSYAVVNNRIFNRGWPVENAQRVIGRQVPRFQVADLRTADPRARIQGNRLALFRPAVNAPGQARTAERIAAEARRGNSPVRQAVRSGFQAQAAAVAGRRAALQRNQRGQAVLNRQQAANARQAGRQQTAARVRGQERNRAAVAQATQANRAQTRARAQRQQVAARSQAQRNRQRVQVNADRRRQQAQRPQHAQPPPRQAERRQNRPQQQAARRQEQVRPQAQRQQFAQQQRPARQQFAQQRPQRQQQVAQQRPQRQQQAAQQRPQRQQVAQQRPQQQRPRNRPPNGSGQPDQRRGHGGY